MNNCFNCKIIKECDCGKILLDLNKYLPQELYEQIKDIIIVQFNCEYHE